MHILFIASFYPNRVRRTVGIFMKNHAEAISKNFKVTVFNLERDNALKTGGEIALTYNGQISEYILYYNPDYFKDKQFGKIRFYYNLFSNVNKMYNQIVNDCGKIDKVHLNVTHPLGIIALYLRLFKNISYVITEHSTLFVLNHYKKSKSIQKLYIKLVFKYADKLSVVTRYLGESIVKLKLYNKQFDVIPNVVPTNLFNIENRLKKSQKPVFIHVSTLRPSKGVDTIIDACYELKSQNIDFSFVIVGGVPSYFERVQKKIIDLNLQDCVQMTGELMPSEIAEEMKKADFFVLNSEYETFCVVMVEAFACGLPIIAPNNTAIPENFSLQRGILIDIQDKEQWVLALKKMLNEYQNYNKSDLFLFVDENFSLNSVAEKFKLFLS